jgi:hypothetical protein
VEVLDGHSLREGAGRASNSHHVFVDGRVGRVWMYHPRSESMSSTPFSPYDILVALSYTAPPYNGCGVERMAYAFSAD